MNKNENPRKSGPGKSRGYTIVEITIVMVIIALIVAIVLTGQSMLKSSKATAIITEINKYTGAVQTFYETYQCLPGDCGNATEILGALVNGNDDGRIEDFSATDGLFEGEQAWYQLVLAKMIEAPITPLGFFQCYLGTISNIDNMGPSKIEGLGYYFHYFDNFLGAGAKNYIGIAMTPGINGCPSFFGAPYYDSGIPPDTSYSIDRKVDDAEPWTGKVQSSLYVPRASECYIITGSGVFYNLAEKEGICSLIFNYDNPE